MNRPVSMILYHAVDVIVCDFLQKSFKVCSVATANTSTSRGDSGAASVVLSDVNFDKKGRSMGRVPLLTAS